MKILHIVSGNLDSGSTKGAYNLHKGLINAGIDSKMLINSPNILQDTSIETISYNRINKLKNIINREVDQIPVKLYVNRKNTSFSTAIKGFDITKHPLFLWADIVHLHWINGGFVNIKDLKKINKPIVWTLRDMWPFTGGCHYSMNCNNYKIKCGKCPQLGSNKINDLSHWILKRKVKYYPKNIKIVGISPWLSDKAKESAVLSGYNIRTIFNNINCDAFFPIEKSIARKILNIKTKKKIVLTGAIALNEFYKGFDKYIESIKNLNKDQVLLLFFGKINNNIINDLGYEYINLGYLNDDISLRLVYSAADVFVAPSIMEAFGKTLAEALACGTPVVCFDSSGPKDIVDHKLNGYKAQNYNSEDLGRGIEWVINNSDPQKLNNQARLKSLNMFNDKVIANQYVELYESLFD